MAINFDAHSNRDQQNLIAFLVQFESAGITDIRFVRERLENHLREKRKVQRLAIPVENRSAARKAAALQKKDRCPSCGRGYLFPALDDQGAVLPENIWACNKCRWSEMRGE